MTSDSKPILKPRKKPTGPRAMTGPTSVRVEEMRSIAQRMRRDRKTLDEIAEHLGVSKGRAHQLVREAMDEVREATFQDSLEWRHELTEEHLDNLKRAKQLRNDSDPETAARGLLAVTRTLKELGDLWGAHAPKKISATNPDGTPAGLPGVVFVPVPMGANDWETRAAVVLEQGEAAALALTNEGATDAVAAKASPGPSAA